MDPFIILIQFQKFTNLILRIVFLSHIADMFNYIDLFVLHVFGKSSEKNVLFRICFNMLFSNEYPCYFYVHVSRKYHSRDFLSFLSEIQYKNTHFKVNGYIKPNILGLFNCELLSTTHTEELPA